MQYGKKKATSLQDAFCHVADGAFVLAVGLSLLNRDT
jgi:hypothetical protein